MTSTSDQSDIPRTPARAEQVPGKRPTHAPRAGALAREAMIPGKAISMPLAQTPVRANRNGMRSESTGGPRQDRRATKRGLPADYAGDDPHSCNAPTKTGMPCRALALSSGHCKKHGGTGELPKRPFKKLFTQEMLIKQVEGFIAKFPGLKERIEARRKA